MKKLFFAVFLSIAFGSTAALASTITYTFSGTGSGTIGATGFGASAPADFVITLTADTAAIQDFGGGVLTNDALSATVSFDGGTLLADITSGVRVFHFSDTVGLSRGGFFGSDLLDLSNSANFTGYGLGTDLGPVTVAAGNLGATYQFAPGFAPAVTTTLGDLGFTSFGDVTFTASTSVVPEPWTWSLLLLAFAGLGWRLRRETFRRVRA